MPSILNISGYKFLALSGLTKLRTDFLEQAANFKLKGTILLSNEGINLNAAGLPEHIKAFLLWLQKDPRFFDMIFRESYSLASPFRVMKVKLKKEIITMRQKNISPTAQKAAALSPEILKQWLDENRDFTLLDTRNDYEVCFGTFRHAKHLHLNHFGEFPESAKKISRDKPIVMFCTGGIRCEKAALVMMEMGHSNVYQLEGGILNYFSKVGGDYFSGECFVFDGRIALDANLQPTDTKQCVICQGPVTKNSHVCMNK